MFFTIYAVKLKCKHYRSTVDTELELYGNDKLDSTETKYGSK